MGHPAAGAWNWFCHVPPPPIQFLHNLPNKPLIGAAILQNLENKGDSLQDLQNAGVMGFFGALGKTQA
jgi:hypothetical protein